MHTTIYLIRHGEVYNPDNILYGRLPNFGLSEKGKKQLEKTGEFLQDKAITKLYASPMQRAQESAAIIQKKLNLPEVIIAEEIAEVMTSYQGKLFSDLDALQSEVYLKPLSPMDETIEQIAQRMKGFIQKLMQTQGDNTMALVSHGDPLVILKTAIQNKPLTFKSFKTNEYMQHGEVYKLTGDSNNTLSIKSVFQPIIR